MIINIREFIANKKKEKLGQRMSAMLQSDRLGVQKVTEEQAPTVEVITAEEIAELVTTVSPSGFEYRINLSGADFHYNMINERNYKAFADKMGHMERESEFIAAMCLIDKCEEYDDYNTMASTFRIFEYVIRHNKTNTPVVTYAREYNIAMRRYLEELNLL